MDWPSAGAFLKEQRRRIPRDAPSLGRYVRLPARRGKVVTQEELAEAIGVSRVWYAMLESGAALNTSPGCWPVSRTPWIIGPEPQRTIQARASGALGWRPRVRHGEGSVRLRRSVANGGAALWSATSEMEIFSAVAETITDIFDDSDFAGAQKRLEPGRWDFPVMFGGETLAGLPSGAASGR